MGENNTERDDILQSRSGRTSRRRRRPSDVSYAENNRKGGVRTQFDGRQNPIKRTDVTTLLCSCVPLNHKWTDALRLIFTDRAIKMKRLTNEVRAPA